MNVCMVAYSFYESDNRVRRYAECLAQRGDRVDAISLWRRGVPRYEVLRGVHVHRIQERAIDERGPASYLLKLLAFFFRSAFVMTRKHLASPYQLIHVHSVPDFQVFAALIPRLTGAKVILDIHDIVPELYASKFGIPEQSLMFRALRLAEKLSAAFAHHVIIANHLWYEKLTRRSVPAAKCSPIINYPDLSIFLPREPAAKSTERFVLCYPGTLNRHQGLDIAVRAMEKVRREVPGALLMIVGDGPERETLRRMINELGLDESVQLRGMVPIEQVAEIMASVDLGIVPKRSNSFGNEAFSTKIMEFMAMGVPVVASETRVDRYYFNERLVRFFRSGDVDELAERIIELARDREARRELASNASLFIGSNSWDVKKQEYYNLVDELTGSEGRARDRDATYPAA